MIFDHVTICHLRYLMVVPSSRNLETRLLGTCVQPCLSTEQSPKEGKVNISGTHVAQPTWSNGAMIRGPIPYNPTRVSEFPGLAITCIHEAEANLSAEKKGLKHAVTFGGCSEAVTGARISSTSKCLWAMTDNGSTHVYDIMGHLFYSLTSLQTRNAGC